MSDVATFPLRHLKPEEDARFRDYLAVQHPDVVIGGEFQGYDFPDGIVRVSTLGRGVKNLEGDIGFFGDAVGYRQKDWDRVWLPLKRRFESASVESADGRLTGLWILGPVDGLPVVVNQGVPGTDEFDLLNQLFEPIESETFVFSLDELFGVDPDVLVFSNYLGEDGLPAYLTQDPRWGQMAAVAADRVLVGPPTDGLGLGPVDYQTFLEAVDAKFR
jgi:hypothetical protein